MDGLSDDDAAVASAGKLVLLMDCCNELGVVESGCIIVVAVAVVNELSGMLVDMEFVAVNCKSAAAAA
jgi:hypothetical protein